MKTKIDPIRDICFAEERQGNSLSNKYPRSQINTAFEAALIHDAKIAHQVLPMLEKAMKWVYVSEVTNENRKAMIEEYESLKATL